jgi:hypothetical protein
MTVSLDPHPFGLVTFTTNCIVDRLVTAGAVYIGLRELVELREPVP